MRKGCDYKMECGFGFFLDLWTLRMKKIREKGENYRSQIDNRSIWMNWPGWWRNIKFYKGEHPRKKKQKSSFAV